ENYPVERGGLSGAGGGLRLCSVSGHDATHYPLSLMVAPSERLQLRLDYRPDLFERASVEGLAGRLVCLVEAGVACGRGGAGRWARLVGWRFCRRRSGARSCKIGTRRSACWRLRRCRSCLWRRRLRRRTRLRSCLGMSSSATGSLRVAPTSWHISCARLGLVR